MPSLRPVVESVDAVQTVVTTPEAGGGRVRYTDEYLLGLLATLASDLGRSPNVMDIKNLSEKVPTIDTYARHFGSFVAALHLIGLESSRKKSDELLLAELYEFANQLGHFPSIKQIDNNEDVSASGTYKYHFGSISKAQQLMEQKYGQRFANKPTGVKDN